ncbi:MAG: TIM barrel protein [Lentisphaeria bacterium]|nr:TIM barrel protein [Lentisphaeria bacterium]
MKIHVTASAFAGEDWRNKLNECRDFTEQCGWEFGVQLHNTSPMELLERLKKENVPLSVHAPFNQNRNWNLATENTKETFEAIEQNLTLFDSLNIHETVFHGGLMSDLSPEAFGHGKSYFECMQAVYRNELAMWDGHCLNRDFRDLPEYKERLLILKENLRTLRNRYPEFTICLENDYPAFGSLDMLFDELNTLEHPLCLDTGHLWISSFLFDLNFHDQIELAMGSGMVAMTHFHASYCTSAVPKKDWTDGHRRLNVDNQEMNLPAALALMKKGGLEFYVLEIAKATVEDIKIFKQWYDEA